MYSLVFSETVDLLVDMGFSTLKVLPGLIATFTPLLMLPFCIYILKKAFVSFVEPAVNDFVSNIFGGAKDVSKAKSLSELDDDSFYLEDQIDLFVIKGIDFDDYVNDNINKWESYADSSKIVRR